MSTSWNWLPKCMKTAPNQAQEVLVPWTSFWKSSWIHIVPLLACIALIVLDRLQVFVFEDNRPDLTNFLQFAAKLLELFILASISTMVLHYARGHLVERGMPYGMLSSTYRATDVMLLFEPSFWWPSAQRLTWSLRGLALLIILVVVYSPLVGPSAAVLLIPALDYYSHGKAFGNSPGRLLFVQPTSNTNEQTPELSRGILYPAQLVADSTFNATFCGANPVQDPGYRKCPGGINLGVFHWPWQFPEDTSTDITEPTYGRVYRAVSSVVFAKPQQHDALWMAASAPSSFFVEILSSVWFQGTGWSQQLPQLPKPRLPKSPHIKLSADSEYFQPVVQTKCTLYGDRRDLETREFVLSSDDLLAFDKRTGWRIQKETNWPVPGEAVQKLLAHSSGDTWSRTPYIEWLEPQDVGTSDSLSLAALISIPSRNNITSIEQPSGRYERTLFSCTFVAHWMPSEISFDPHGQFHVATKWTDADDKITNVLQDIYNGDLPGQKLPSPLAHITIKHSWISLLTEIPIMMADRNEELGSAVATHFGPYRFPNGSVNGVLTSMVLRPLTNVLNSALTASISNHGLSKPTVLLYTSTNNSIENLRQAAGVAHIAGPYLFPNTPSVMSNWTGDIPEVYELELKVDRLGYSWGNRVASVRFGLAVFIIYIGALSLYAIHGLVQQVRQVSKPPHRVRAFGGTHDIITLAMNSQPPKELNTCGAGVQDRNTWKKHVKVRAPHGESNVLELLFEDRPGMAKVEPKIKYS